MNTVSVSNNHNCVFAFKQSLNLWTSEINVINWIILLYIAVRKFHNYLHWLYTYSLAMIKARLLFWYFLLSFTKQALVQSVIAVFSVRSEAIFEGTLCLAKTVYCSTSQEFSHQQRHRVFTAGGLGGCCNPQRGPGQNPRYWGYCFHHLEIMELVISLAQLIYLQRKVG